MMPPRDARRVCLRYPPARQWIADDEGAPRAGRRTLLGVCTAFLVGGGCLPHSRSPIRGAAPPVSAPGQQRPAAVVDDDGGRRPRVDIDADAHDGGKLTL